MGATVQMNMRIDADLKARGDVALETAGFTPSRAVRLLWQFASGCRDEPEKIVAVLDPGRMSVPEDERAQKAAALKRGWDICAAFLSVRTVSGTSVGLPSDRELLEDALFERLEEKGLA